MQLVRIPNEITDISRINIKEAGKIMFYFPHGVQNLLKKISSSLLFSNQVGVPPHAHQAKVRFAMNPHSYCLHV